MTPDAGILLVAGHAALAVNFCRQAVCSPAPCFVMPARRFLLVASVAGVLFVAERALVPFLVEESFSGTFTVQSLPRLVVVGWLDAHACFFVTNTATIRLSDIFLMTFQAHCFFAGKKEVSKDLRPRHFAVTRSTVFFRLDMLCMVKNHVSIGAGLQVDRLGNWLFVAHIAGFALFLAMVCLFVAFHAGFLARHPGKGGFQCPLVTVET